MLVAAIFWSLLVVGLVTFGLGWWFLGFVPLVPFAYHCLFLTSGLSATPGQALFGLMVRRNDDLGPPSLAQAAGVHAGLLPDAGDLRPAVAGGAVHPTQAHPA